MVRPSQTQRGHRRYANPPRLRRSSSAAHSNPFYRQPHGTGAPGSAHHHGSGNSTANGYNAGLPYSVSDCGSRLPASDCGGSDYGGRLPMSDYGGELPASDYGGGPPASDYGGGLSASDYYDTQPTHLQSVFTGENGTAQHSGYSRYTQDDNSSGHAFLSNTHQPPPSITLGNDFLSGPYVPTDTARQATHHVPNAAPDDLLHTGGHFLDQGSSSQPGTNPSLIHESTIPSAHLDLALSGTDEQFLPLDSLGQSGLPDQLDNSLQPDLRLSDFSGPDYSLPNTTQIDLFQGHAIPDIPQNDTQDAVYEGPWNSQLLGSCGPRQPDPLSQTPSPRYSAGLSPPQTWAPAAIASLLSTVSSPQGSQRDDSSQVAWCDSCEQGFSSQKAYQRHLATAIAHQDGEDRVWICKCGITANRKDNYRKRHLENCPNPHLHGPSDFYTCICRYRDASASGMKHHLTECPDQRRRGRPSSLKV